MFWRFFLAARSGQLRTLIPSPCHGPCHGPIKWAMRKPLNSHERMSRYVSEYAISRGCNQSIVSIDEIADVVGADLLHHNPKVAVSTPASATTHNPLMCIRNLRSTCAQAQLHLALWHCNTLSSSTNELPRVAAIPSTRNATIQRCPNDLTSGSKPAFISLLEWPQSLSSCLWFAPATFRV